MALAIGSHWPYWRGYFSPSLKKNALAVGPPVASAGAGGDEEEEEESLLSAERNALLTQVGPGTPMGQLLRRYWWP
ncbi:MAG: hypothetical protein K6U87_16990, partial [Firmicutes bacterium]|nr:hypothetical protein [Bacillota bacterium]